MFNKNNTALLVIDMTNEFVTGSVTSPRAKHCLEPARLLVNAARKVHVPVLFCNDTHDPSDRELEIWGPHSMRGTDGAHVIAELEVTSTDYVVEKHTYGAFFQTKTKEILDSLNVKTLIVFGLYTNICVKYSIVEAYLHGYDVIMALGATDGFTEELYKQSLEELTTVTNVKLIPYHKIITELEK